MNSKADIRRQIAALKKELTAGERLRRSAGALARLRELDVFRAARSVGLYLPLPDEVDIGPLPAAGGKTFYIPAFDEQAGGYRLARHEGPLRPGRFGIPEPAAPRFAEPGAPDLILVPGTAFDGRGGRIGRGGGFYDRMLPLYPAPCVGLCFDFQLVEAVPCEPHDRRMDWVVTEKRILEVCAES